jgi:hypothetical protein
MAATVAQQAIQTAKSIDKYLNLMEETATKLSIQSMRWQAVALS